MPLTGEMLRAAIEPVAHLLRQGMSPLLVARIAGHDSLEMIRAVYSHLTVSDAHDALVRALGADDDETLYSSGRN